MLDTICEVLASGEKVFISGFGTFEVRDRIARAGRNPRTGEDIITPGQKTAAFKAGKILKDSVK
jgi:DNA-binding protein HU-beta